MRRQSLKLIPCIAVGLLSACAGQLGAGVDAFHNADHARALAAFTDVEPSQLSVDEYARYALYRGLTHLALGDLSEAQHHLAACKALVDEHRDGLTLDERLRLRQAWLSMGLMPRQAPPR